MILCVYCGASSDKGKTCAVCGNNLADADPGQGPFEDEFLPTNFEVPDISGIEIGYSFEEGFSRPDWKRLMEVVQESFPREEWHEVWCELGKQWLLQLKQDLGGSYKLHETPHFLLLSAEASSPARTILEYAENALANIESQLGTPAKLKRPGKKVILAFSEEDDYYTYISYYYSEGEHSTSAGVFIHRDYGHIAFPFRFVYSTKRLLVHELTHYCLWGLHLPTWLEEGIAQAMEDLHLNRGFSLDMDLVEQHRTFWDTERIQEFWSGLSFRRTGDSVKLSYSLAEILVNHLGGKGGQFKEFLAEADRRDAGQNAALQFLDCSLGDVLGGFLGPGEWRPNRKVIAQHWEQPKKKKESENGNKEQG